VQRSWRSILSSNRAIVCRAVDERAKGRMHCCTDLLAFPRGTYNAGPVHDSGLESALTPGGVVSCEASTPCIPLRQARDWRSGETTSRCRPV
jgi:hypothetical protein